MIIVITILHFIMCLVLIAIVLLQTGKGASMGAAFGGASNTLFGGAGPASFLNKITTIAAVVFMLTSFTLAIMSNREITTSKVLDATSTQQEQPAEQAATPSATGEEQDSSSTTEEASSSEEQPVEQDSSEDNETKGVPE
jgi:preprotein translocase subunit SecG